MDIEDSPPYTFFIEVAFRFIIYFLDLALAALENVYHLISLWKVDRVPCLYFIFLKNSLDILKRNLVIVNPFLWNLERFHSWFFDPSTWYLINILEKY